MNSRLSNMEYNIVTNEQNGATIVTPKIANIEKIKIVKNPAHNPLIDKQEEKEESIKDKKREIEELLEKKQKKVDDLMKLYRNAKTKEAGDTYYFELQQYELQVSKLTEALINITTEQEHNNRRSYYDESEQSEQEKAEILKLIESV